MLEKIQPGFYDAHRIIYDRLLADQPHGKFQEAISAIDDLIKQLRGPIQ
jgi:hypothetical protein